MRARPVVAIIDPLPRARHPRCDSGAGAGAGASSKRVGGGPFCNPHAYRHRLTAAALRSTSHPPREPTRGGGVAIWCIVATSPPARPRRRRRAAFALSSSARRIYAIYVDTAVLIASSHAPFCSNATPGAIAKNGPGAQSASGAVSIIQLLHPEPDPRIRWIMRGDIGGVQTLGIAPSGAAPCRGKCLRLQHHS